MIKEVYPKLQPVSRVRLIKPRAVTTEAPQQGRQPAGQIPGDFACAAARGRQGSMKVYGWGNAPHSADQYSEAIGLAR